MKKDIILLFATLALWVFASSSVFAEEAPWYKKAWKKWIKSDQVESAVPTKIPAPVQEAPVTTRIREAAVIPEKQVAPEDFPDSLSSDGYEGPDLSEERSIEDELLIRTIPLPQTNVPQPPRKPPTPGQYAVPQPKMPRRDVP
jgi:hypothetical protein